MKFDTYIVYTSKQDNIKTRLKFPFIIHFTVKKQLYSVAAIIVTKYYTFNVTFSDYAAIIFNGYFYLHCEAD